MKKHAPSSRWTELTLGIVLTVAVLGVSALMWFYRVQDPWLLHLYYLPVVLSGFYLGCKQARLLSLLCILTGTIVFVPNLDQSSTGIPLLTALAFGLWGAMLTAVSAVVGLLSERWRTALRELSDAHKKDVLTDGLTGAASRRAFEYELSRRLAEWKRHKSPMGMLLFDIDHFKSFNDRYGHDAGDAILRQTAAVLQEAVRETDVVARFGGEEFAVLLPASDAENSREVAERARRLIEKKRFTYKGLRLRLTISAGVAEAIPDEEVVALVQRADAALYASKAAGRNCVHYHDGECCRRFGSGAAAVVRDPQEPPAVGRHVDSHKDMTTGLPSRAVFLDELRRRTAETHRYGGHLTVALVKVNDYFCTPSDDANARNSLIATLGRLSTSVLRDADLVARYEEDVLAILLPSTMLNGAWIPLRRLTDRAADRADPKYPTLSYRVSIGAAQLLPREEMSDLMQRIDVGLTAAIGGGNSAQPLDDDPARVCSMSAYETSSVDA